MTPTRWTAGVEVVKQEEHGLHRPYKVREILIFVLVLRWQKSRDWRFSEGGGLAKHLALGHIPWD